MTICLFHRVSIKSTLIRKRHSHATSIHLSIKTKVHKFVTKQRKKKWNQYHQKRVQCDPSQYNDNVDAKAQISATVIKFYVEKGVWCILNELLFINSFYEEQGWSCFRCYLFSLKMARKACKKNETWWTSMNIDDTLRRHAKSLKFLLRYKTKNWIRQLHKNLISTRSVLLNYIKFTVVIPLSSTKEMMSQKFFNT